MPFTPSSVLVPTPPHTRAREEVLVDFFAHYLILIKLNEN